MPVTCWNGVSINYLLLNTYNFLRHLYSNLSSQQKISLIKTSVVKSPFLNSDKAFSRPSPMRIPGSLCKAHVSDVLPRWACRGNRGCCRGVGGAWPDGVESPDFPNLFPFHDFLKKHKKWKFAHSLTKAHIWLYLKTHLFVCVLDFKKQFKQNLQEL